jgi:hypothetical protein
MQAADCPFADGRTCIHPANAGSMEITGTPIYVHGNFPHHWSTLCVTLMTIVNHQAPANHTEACQGLTPSP